MHVGRTSEIVMMASFERFYQDLLELARKYEQENLPLKIEKDPDHDILKIFGEKTTSLARAQNGLNDVAELAYAAAEHHPYWNLLYHCTEISSSALEKWRSSLSEDDFSEIAWAIKELNQALEKIKQSKPSRC